MRTALKATAMAAAIWAGTPGCVVEIETEEATAEADELGTASDELSKTTCRKLCSAKPTKGTSKLQCIAQCVRYETAKICRNDNDCELYADYCGGCYCDSLNRPLPLSCAPGEQVHCFADPCIGKQPVCVQGRCLPY